MREKAPQVPNAGLLALDVHLLDALILDAIERLAALAEHTNIEVAEELPADRATAEDDRLVERDGRRPLDTVVRLIRELDDAVSRTPEVLGEVIAHDGDRRRERIALLVLRLFGDVDEDGRQRELALLRIELLPRLLGQLLFGELRDARNRKALRLLLARLPVVLLGRIVLLRVLLVVLGRNDRNRQNRGQKEHRERANDRHGSISEFSRKDPATLSLDGFQAPVPA